MTNPGKEKIAFVCQRYGLEVNGGSELYCREVAEHLAETEDVTVYTTCAVDYITWNNEYPAGESTLNGVHIRRWPVQFPRQRIIQGICGRWIRYSPVHSSAVERRWIRAQGPVCDAALDALWEHQGEYRAIFFMTYLYYLTAMGVPRGFRNALLIPTLHDEWPAYLRHYDRVFRGAKGIVWNSREELEFAEKRFPGIGTVPGVKVQLRFQLVRFIQNPPLSIKFGHIFKSQHPLVGIHLFELLVGGLRHRVHAAPGDDVAPPCLLPRDIVDIRHPARLRDGDQLHRADLLHLLDLFVVPAREGTVILRAGDVAADNVHIFPAREPVRAVAVPDPDQIVESVLIRQAVVQCHIELLIGIRYVRAPPEPLA